MFFKNFKSTSSIFLKIFLVFGLSSVSGSKVVPHNQQNVEKSNALLKSCVIPTSRSTSYELAQCSDDNCALEPGKSIPGNGTVVRLVCEKMYVLNNNKIDIAVCFDGAWFPKKHSCVRGCRPLTLNSLDINCTYNGEAANCKKDVKTGTAAKLMCKDKYHADDDFSKNYCRRSGKWEYRMYECQPICGEIDDSIGEGPLGLTDDMNDTSSVPWNAAIYFKVNGTYELRCGGSVISQDRLISAAKCIMDDSGSTYPPSMFKIAVGKLYKNWSDERDINVQKFNVREVNHIQAFRQFFGGNKLIIDFAKSMVVFLLQGAIKFNKFVAPICIDTERNNRFANDLIGTIVGWNIRNKDEGSSKLLKYRMKIHTNDECKAVMLESNETIDHAAKFCTDKLGELEDFYGAGVTFIGGRYTGVSINYVFGILTEHFKRSTFYLGFRDKASEIITNAMKAHFNNLKNDDSIQ